MTAKSAFRRLAAASWFSTACAGSVLIAAMLALYVAQPLLAVRLDLKVYDMLLPLRAAPRASPTPVIVDLDEASLAAYGQWPWPRYLVADLVDALSEYRVAAIGIDVMFAESDRSSPEHVFRGLERDRSISLSIKGLPAPLRDYDRLLGDSLKKSPAVLGFYGRFDGSSSALELPASVNAIIHAAPGAPAPEDRLQSAENAVVPLPVLRETAPLGFINVAPDADGIVRKVPLVIQVKGAIYPSLPLRALMRVLETRNLRLRAGAYGLESVGAGAYTVAVNPRGEMYIPFIGPSGTYRYVSARDVLRREAPRETLEGRVVFVGTSAAGLLDIHATPLDPVCPGVEIHAAALDAILSENAIRMPPWTPAAQVAGILFTGILATLGFGFARPRTYLPAAAALVAAAVMLSRRLFADGVFLSPLYMLTTVGVLGLGLVFLRFWQEERQKIVLRSSFSRYVSPEVVKRIARLSGDFFAGEERELSILFTDIRGFTSISEGLSPRQVVALLDRYFTPMTALVLKSGGTLDKFIGDALMAFWNAPLDVSEHPVKAVEAALAMQEALGVLNGELRAEFGVEIGIGAGVNTGPAYVGNMGSRDRINYTLIGDNVNLASRLEGLCKLYGVPVAVSGETRKCCGDAFVFQYMDTLRVKGKGRPVGVLVPLRREDAALRSDELAEWESARVLYHAGDFTRALEAISELVARYPARKLYAVYAERLRALKDDPPKNWDGVWTLTSK
ncbi:MAG: adenylate/guanylate cyclase domain-containing protein [Candidatus Accumulibacter sp.]|nr:adenylate/guanylate cyclase domain-containing protein [Accumulibacter sp.]